LLIEWPVYCCGPPVAQHTISVTRYLNPARDTRWCASSTRGFEFSFGSSIIRSTNFDDRGDAVHAAQTFVQ
jgi:hypothetical protein